MAAVKAATDEVQKALQAIGEKIYAATAQAQGAPEGASGPQQGGDDGVVDADYEVVDDN